jgi:hypothetical protein
MPELVAGMTTVDSVQVETAPEAETERTATIKKI